MRQNLCEETASASLEAIMVWEIVLLKLGRWKSMRPDDSPSARQSRILVSSGSPRGARDYLFERAWRIVLPPLVVAGIFVCVSWTGLWIDAPHWARASAFSRWHSASSSPCCRSTHFVFPRARRRSRGSTGIRRCIASRGGDRRPTRQWGDGSGNPGLWSLHRRARNKRWLCCVPAAIATHGRS